MLEEIKSHKSHRGTEMLEDIKSCESHRGVETGVGRA
jgi:hypothetical protein